MTTDVPDLSVIIPTRNRYAMLGSAIQSVVARSTDEFAIEIIVVDDGSTDDTPLLRHDQSIRYVRGKGEGAASARNLGCLAANGDFITFLDDDDVWVGECPVPQLRRLISCPEYGAVMSQIMLADEDLNPCFGPFPLFMSEQAITHMDLMRYIPGVSSIIARKNVVSRLGPLDTSLLGGEDWDWVLRMKAHYEITFVAEVAVLVRQHDGQRHESSSSPDVQLWRRMRDVVRVYRRHNRNLSLADRLRAVPPWWSYRGWFAFQFAQSCVGHWSRHELRHALRALSYSLAASLPHSIKFFVTNQARRE